MKGMHAGGWSVLEFGRPKYQNIDLSRFGIQDLWITRAVTMFWLLRWLQYRSTASSEPNKKFASLTEAMCTIYVGLVKSGGLSFLLILRRWLKKRLTEYAETEGGANQALVLGFRTLTPRRNTTPALKPRTPTNNERLGNTQSPIHAQQLLILPLPHHRRLEIMSLSIDLTTHGKQLQQVYDKIISGSADTSWAVFSYDKGASNELKVQSQGSNSLATNSSANVDGELDEIIDEFSDGRVSYGCTTPHFEAV